MTISEAERERLAARIRDAASICFPAGEQMGGSPQQDFNFRLLLEHLIANAHAYGIPVTGGTTLDLHAFFTANFEAWTNEYAMRQQRVGKRVKKQLPYRLDQLRVVVSKWADLFDQPRSRAVSGSRVVFSFTPGTQTRDSVLAATVESFRLDDGTLLNVVPPAELGDELRLSSLENKQQTENKPDTLIGAIAIDADYTSLRQAHHAAMLKMSPDALKKHQEDLRAAQHLPPKDRRKQVASIILSAITFFGALFYVITRQEKVEPLIHSHFDHFEVANVVAEDGRIAMTDSAGKVVTPWSDRIVDDDGNWIEAGGTDPATGKPLFTVHTKGVHHEFPIPPRWKEDSSAALMPEITFGRSDPRSPLSVIVWILADTRAWPKPTVANAPQFRIRFEDHGPVVVPGMIVYCNKSRTRVLMAATYNYARPADHTISLSHVASCETVQWLPTQKLYAYSKCQTAEQALVKIRVSNGRGPTLVEVNPAAPKVTFTAPGILLAGARPLPQAYVTRDAGATTLVVGVVPDLRTWPARTELSSAVYGAIVDGTDYLGKSALMVRPMPEGAPPGSAYELILLRPLRDGEHVVEFECRQGQRRVPSIKMRIRVTDGTPSFLGTRPEHITRRDGAEIVRLTDLAP